MKKLKYLLPVLIIGFYSLTFIATTRYEPCVDDCEKVSNFDQAIRQGRENYIGGVVRCSRSSFTDTLCIFAVDTAGTNWQLFADTACNIAMQNGLDQQHIFILYQVSGLADTLAIKNCP